MFHFLWSTLPGLDEPVAGVRHVLHLEEDSGVQGSQNQTVVKVQAGCVHEVQQEGETLRVHLVVQVNGAEVAVLRSHEHRIEVSTAENQKPQGLLVK